MFSPRPRLRRRDPRLCAPHDDKLTAKHQCPAALQRSLPSKPGGAPRPQRPHSCGDGQAQVPVEGSWNLYSSGLAGLLLITAMVVSVFSCGYYLHVGDARFRIFLSHVRIGNQSRVATCVVAPKASLRLCWGRQSSTAGLEKPVGAGIGACRPWKRHRCGGSLNHRVCSEGTMDG